MADEEDGLYHAHSFKGGREWDGDAFKEAFLAKRLHARERLASRPRQHMLGGNEVERRRVIVPRLACLLLGPFRPLLRLCLAC